MSWAITQHDTEDEAKLRVGTWRSPNARATCLLCPGLGDFLEKRAPVAEALAAVGHDVISLDWRGQGGSGRFGHNMHAVHVDSFDQLARDLGKVCAKLAHPNWPVWLMGYSMGATVALLAITNQQVAPRAVVLVSPMLAMRLPMPEIAVRVLSEAAVLAGRSRAFACGEAAKPDAMGTADGELRDRAAHDGLRRLAMAHPDLNTTGVTWGWTRAALRAMARVRRAPSTGVPTLIVAAQEDRSVDLRLLPDFARRHAADLLRIEGDHDLFLSGRPVLDQVLSRGLDFVQDAIEDRDTGFNSSNAVHNSGIANLLFERDP